jgi:hypothetical protein
LRRRQAVKRQRFAEGANDLCWSKLLVLEHPVQTCSIIVVANGLKTGPLKIF